MDDPSQASRFASIDAYLLRASVKRLTVFKFSQVCRKHTVSQFSIVACSPAHHLLGWTHLMMHAVLHYVHTPEICIAVLPVDCEFERKRRAEERAHVRRQRQFTIRPGRQCVF